MPPYRKPGKLMMREEEQALATRDYVMARAAAAIAALDGAKQNVLDAVTLFITPSDDRKGRERKECLDSAIESASIATRALEDAMDKFDDANLEAVEPWEEEDDDPDGAD